jgi:hypothetical protein
MIQLIRRADVEQDPYAIWNKFVDLLARSEYEDLSDVQRPPYLTFWYESEVQNGGHLQFFLNRPAFQLDLTIEALRILEADGYFHIFRDALERWRSRSGLTPRLIHRAAIAEEFEDLDSAFYAVQPTLIERLERYLDANQSSFILLTE